MRKPANMKILIPEHCPICAALQYGVDNAKPGKEQQSLTDLRAHQRRHDFGFYNAMCPVCEDFLSSLECWLDLSDEDVIRIHEEYEVHYEVAHQQAGLAQSLWPGAQLTQQ